jgi:hypothetical protein
MTSAIRRASSIALAGIAWAGHLLGLIAAATDSVPRNTILVAAIACSIIALAASTELAGPHGRMRHAITALTCGHGLAAAVLVAALAPSVPRWAPLAGLAAAAALGLAGLAMVGPVARLDHPPRPLILAPRVAAIALVVQALLQRWSSSTTSMAVQMRAAILLSIAALGIALLASLSIIALRVQSRWVIAGLLAWTVGWVASAADLSSLILWSFGGPFPLGSHQLRQLDAELVQILATLGGLAIGSALITSIRDARFRHSALVLLAGYAAFGLIAAVSEHRIELASDFPGVTALRKNRDLADEITGFALAGVLWLYWRRVAASSLARADQQD